MLEASQLLLVLLTAVPLVAQSVPEGTLPPSPPRPGSAAGVSEPQTFLGLDWGASAAEVKKYLPAKCLKPRTEKDGTVMTRCEIFNYLVGSVRSDVVLMLENDAFTAARVTFPTAAYEDMRRYLLSVYGASPRVSVVKEKEGKMAHVFDPSRPVDLYEITRTVWVWPGTVVDLNDNRHYTPYKDQSSFGITRITARMKAAKAQ